MTFTKYQDKGAYHYHWYRDIPWYKASVDRIVEFCIGSTIDVGCGDGFVSKMISDKGLKVTGIDNDPTGIHLAKIKDIKSEYITQDITKPIKGKWEYMACLNVIEHLQDPLAIKRIFSRNITKAAIIITDMPQEHPSSSHIKEFTPYELKQLFNTHKVKWFKIDDNFHGIEVRKT
jgi:2-polyprenyl-3-methyl-5-hydroxy-6-metoxy-1,4-benzoquinol methylase